VPRLRAIGKPRDDTNWTDKRVRIRYEALKRAGGCCECCGAPGTLENPLEVDHIKPRSQYPKLMWNLDNVQILCLLCNRGKGVDETDWRTIKAEKCQKDIAE